MRLLIILSISILSFPAFGQNKVHIPKNSNGSPVVSEKFEMLSHFINERIISQNVATEEMQEDIIQLEQRAQGEVLVTQDAESEFEIHAAVNPTDPANIVAASIAFDGASMTAPIALSIYTSFDTGSTWTKSNFTGDPGIGISAGGGDPILAFDDQGELYLTWLLISISDDFENGYWGFYSANSSDGGLNWTIEDEPIVVEEFVDFFFFSDLERAPDKQWMATDVSSSSPHQGNVYMAYTMLQIDNNTQEVDYNITFVIKPKGESAFQSDSLVLNTEKYIVAQFTSIDTDNEGNIYVSFLGDDSSEEDQYALFFLKSTDGGQTFTEEEKIVTINFPEIGTGNYGIEGMREDRFYPCPHLAIDKSGGVNDGRIYFTFTGFGFDPTNVTGADVYLMYSDDQGDNWSDPALVNNDFDVSAHQYYSSLTVSDLGDVVVSWYDRRDDLVGANTNYYLGVSKDGGESFIQFPVSSATSDFELIGSKNDGFGIGEYTQVVTSGEYAIPFWADGRTNDGDIAIYAYVKDLDDLSSNDNKLIQLNTPFNVQGPFPNPAIATTELQIDVNSKTDLGISILSIDGKVVKSIATQSLIQGRHTISVDTQGLIAGEYLIRLSGEQSEQTKKLIIK